MCAPENGKGTATNRFALKPFIQPNSSTSCCHSLGNLASVTKLSSSKELVEKYLWTLNSFAKPAPAYRSARTPVVVQAPFQNNQPWACLLELIPTSAKAHLSGKASNGNVKLPFMDNWPQALGEILQVLITLTVQNVCLIFGGRASWAPVTCKWLLMHFLRQKKLESPCH